MMIVSGFKFAMSIGIGCLLLLFAAVVVSAVIFQLECLAIERGWRDEPNRAMPKVRPNSVVPFGPRHSAPPPSRRKAE